MNYRFSQGDHLDREAAAAELRRFLDLVIRGMGLDLRFEIITEDPRPDTVEPVEVRVRFFGRDEDIVLERNGELLDALDYLGVRWLRLDPHLYDRIQFDAADSRAGRIEELKLSARIAAQRVAETGQPFRFNPMSPRERRILHLTVAEIPGIQSSSEGAGESRHVVISRAPKQASKGP